MWTNAKQKNKDTCTYIVPGKYMTVTDEGAFDMFANIGNRVECTKTVLVHMSTLHQTPQEIVDYMFADYQPN